MIVHTECYTLMNTDTRGNTDLFTHLLTVTMQPKHDRVCFMYLQITKAAITQLEQMVWLNLLVCDLKLYVTISANDCHNFHLLRLNQSPHSSALETTKKTKMFFLWVCVRHLTMYTNNISEKNPNALLYTKKQLATIYTLVLSFNFNLRLLSFYTVFFKVLFIFNFFLYFSYLLTNPGANRN